jgi:cytochrome c oxidase subunit 2
MSAATEPPAAAAGRTPRHWVRMFVIWFVLSLAADLVTWFVWYPHMPPGDMSQSAHDQQFDIGVLSITAIPVVIMVLLYFIYSIIVFRARPGDDGDGAPIYGHNKIATGWILATALIVMWAFGFGTYELVVPAGAGSGEGPAPIWQLAGKTSAKWTPGPNNMLQVQVIGQQWAWTFRYPQFGGMESSELYLPVNTPIESHVTSLDVIHSFWAYELGVKADANPGVDNVAYTTVKQSGLFQVRCNELCGIWHGAMYTTGHATTSGTFLAWAQKVQQQETNDGLLSALPAYALTYDPTVLPQLSSTNNLNKVDGITGANGYYYPGPQAGTNNGDPVSP